MSITIRDGKVEGKVVNQQWGDDYFSEEVVAIGPWHARFIFCGKYGVRPDKVKVIPAMRGKSYWCEVERPLPPGSFRILAPWFNDTPVHVEVPINPEATSSFVVLE